MSACTACSTTSATSCEVGQTSCRCTSLPGNGSLYGSQSIVPASAYATTSGGDAREFILTSGLMRPSKLRLPLNTETTARSCSLTASEISSGSGPELPMQVVQP